MKIGETVTFGRRDKRTGVIIKMNAKSVKIKCAGNEIWNVGYSLIDSGEVPTPKVEKLEYNQFADVDNLILEAIHLLYNKLNPEFLLGDGGADVRIVTVIKKDYEKKLRKLQEAFGRAVSENEVRKWMKQKQLSDTQK